MLTGGTSKNTSASRRVRKVAFRRDTLDVTPNG